MKRFLLGISGFFIVAFGQPSFAPWLEPMAAAFGFALFWLSIEVFPFALQRFWRSVLWYGSVALVQLSWMTSIEFQGPYILGVLLGLSLLLGLQFGLLTLFIPHGRNLSVTRLLAMAAFWVLLEWTRFHYVFCGFSWNPVGLALSEHHAVQMASLFGVLGLSFWVILVNLLALRCFSSKKTSLWMIWTSMAVIPYVFGICHLFYHERQKTKTGGTLSCALVQTGLLPSEKMLLQGRIQAFISPYEQWKRILINLKQLDNQQIDLVVLPEAALPTSNYSQKRVEKIFEEIFGSKVRNAFPESVDGKISNGFWTQTLANLFKSEVIIGLDHVEKGQAFASAFHFVPEGGSPTRYDKRKLMPLAEYLPFEWLRPLVHHYGIEDFFTPGLEAKVFKGRTDMAVSICYEETFPDIGREGREKGGKLFVNVTNDGWYPFSRLPSQHYEHAKLRAIENGVPLIRACNTGITAAVDSLGQEIARLKEYDEKGYPYSGVLVTKINTYEYPTLFQLWGNKVIIGFSLFFLALFFLIQSYPKLISLLKSPF